VTCAARERKYHVVSTLAIVAIPPTSLMGDRCASSAIPCALISWLNQAKIDNASTVSQRSPVARSSISDRHPPPLLPQQVPIFCFTDFPYASAVTTSQDLSSRNYYCLQPSKALGLRTLYSTFIFYCSRWHRSTTKPTERTIFDQKEIPERFSIFI
jgi:hypothetical protein